MRNILLSSIVITTIFFTGCSGGDGSSDNSTNNDTSSSYTITAVDGYIKNAIVKDSAGEIATYSNNGKYVFEYDPVHPITLSGGELEDTNVSFDINLTTHMGSVISPITTFIGNDDDLRGKLSNISEFNSLATMEEFSVDYIKNDNLNLAKLSQLLYMILKDDNLTNQFKANLGSPTQLSELFTRAKININSTMGTNTYKYELLLEKIKAYNNTVANFEAYLKESKIFLNNSNSRIILRTGQIKSYDVSGNEVNDQSLKDDGYYKKGVAKGYTDNSDGTILDNATGLLWQKEDDNATRNWSEAKDYCSNLTLGGKNDWRLPNINELYQLTDKSVSPAINSVFVGTQGAYWSSTSYYYDYSNAYNVGFSLGNDRDTVKTDGSNNVVRCISGEESQQQGVYVRDDIKEVVTDTSTNLIWQDNNDTKSIKKSWTDAINYCEDLTLSGYTNWYLPNINELYLLTDKNTNNPSISNVFQNTINQTYWTSTTMRAWLDEAWSVNFYAATDGGNENKTNLLYLRCVHDISNILSSENKFTSKWLNNKILYDVYQDLENGDINNPQWSENFVTSHKFENGKMYIADGISTNYIASFDYSITEEGLITYFDDFDYDNDPNFVAKQRWIHFNSQNNDFIEVCYSSDKVGVMGCGNLTQNHEVFFLDKDKAKIAFENADFFDYTR